MNVLYFWKWIYQGEETVSVIHDLHKVRIEIFSVPQTDLFKLATLSVAKVCMFLNAAMNYELHFSQADG